MLGQGDQVLLGVVAQRVRDEIGGEGFDGVEDHRRLVDRDVPESQSAAGRGVGVVVERRGERDLAMCLLRGGPGGAGPPPSGARRADRVADLVPVGFAQRGQEQGIEPVPVPGKTLHRPSDLRRGQRPHRNIAVPGTKSLQLVDQRQQSMLQLGPDHSRRHATTLGTAADTGPAPATIRTDFSPSVAGALELSVLAPSWPARRAPRRRPSLRAGRTAPCRAPAAPPAR